MKICKYRAENIDKAFFSSIVLEEKEEGVNTIVDVSADCDKMLVSDISRHLIEVMLRCGGTIIMEDTPFDMIRYSPVPATIVENGPPIASTLRSGVMVENKVYVPALVQIKK